MEREVGGYLVTVFLALPESTARTTHIPVRELIDKIRNLTAGAEGIVLFQAVGHRLDQQVEFAQDPAVHQRALFHGDVVLAGLEAVDIGVEGVEGVRVPERKQEFTNDLVDVVLAEAPREPRGADGEEVPTQGVGPLSVQHGPGVHHISDVFGHLAAFAVEAMAQANHILVARMAVGPEGADGQEAVEPATGLVDGLANEVGRETLFPDVLVLKGVVPLRLSLLHI